MAKMAQMWHSLADQGFPGYEINRQADIRPVGGAVRVTNAEGALGLVDAEGVKRFRSAGKLCREVFGAEVPGATISRTKLTPEQVAEIRRRPDAPTVLAAEMGVSPSTIKAARRGLTWQRVKVKPRARGYETDSEAIKAA
jgi:hypothetical protein